MIQENITRLLYFEILRSDYDELKSFVKKCFGKNVELNTTEIDKEYERLKKQFLTPYIINNDNRHSK